MAKAVLLHFVLQLCSVKARKRTYPRSYWPELAKGLCSLHFADMGRWWGTNPRTKQQEEIDIMAVRDNNSALIIHPHIGGGFFYYFSEFFLDNLGLISYSFAREKFIF